MLPINYDLHTTQFCGYDRNNCRKGSAHVISSLYILIFLVFYFRNLARLQALRKVSLYLYCGNSQQWKCCCSLVFQWAPLISLIYILLLITTNGIQSESKWGRSDRDAEGGSASSAHTTYRVPAATGGKSHLIQDSSLFFHFPMCVIYRERTVVLRCWKNFSMHMLMLTCSRDECWIYWRSILSLKDTIRLCDVIFQKVFVTLTGSSRWSVSYDWMYWVADADSQSSRSWWS